METAVSEGVVAAKFRWRLDSKTLPALAQYVVDVQQDYFNKSLSVTVLDAIVNGKPMVHTWILDTLLDSSNEEFTLTQFSANGDVLYRKVLQGIKLIGHKCNHNYECEGDDLVDHELLFTYDKIKTIDNVN